MNSLAKGLLVSTALSPILGAVAVNQIAHGENWTTWGAWLAVSLVLVLVCRGLLWYAAGNVQRQAIRIKQFERNDQEVIAFLIAYLVPFLSPNNLMFTDHWLTGAYILAVVCAVIAHANALHFNPVMGFLGFHFHGVMDEHGISRVLISRKEIRGSKMSIQAVRLAHNIYLRVGDEDA